MMAKEWKDLVLSRYERGGTECLARRQESAANAVAAAVRPGPGDRVLDVGAGLGSAAAAVARHGSHAFAIDLSPRQVINGSARTAVAEFTVTWAVADMEALPFADGAFTCVVSNFGLIYSARPRHALDEALRVLKPRGRIALSAYVPNGFTARARALINRFLDAKPPPALLDTEQWGRPEVLGAWFSERGCRVETSRLALSETYPSLMAFWQQSVAEAQYVHHLTRRLSPARLANFKREYCALAEEHGVSVANGLRVDAEYLLTRAVKSAR